MGPRRTEHRRNGYIHKFSEYRNGQSCTSTIGYLVGCQAGFDLLKYGRYPEALHTIEQGSSEYYDEQEISRHAHRR